MANENKKINELVSDDDDPTAELEALTLSREQIGADADIEADANTFDFDELAEDARNGVSIADLRTDLKTRSETIERLQFDIEQLHAKWLGLETEIKAREELTGNLNAELKSVERKLARKEKLLQKRDASIKGLKAEIRERDQRYRELEQKAEELLAANAELETGNEIDEARRRLKEYEGLLASQGAQLRDTQTQQQRTEQYADQLRQQLDDLSKNSELALGERASLQRAVSDAERRIATLESELGEAQARVESYDAELAEERLAHEQELRALRFELGAAEQTMSESQEIHDQLQADLDETLGFKVQLENMLLEKEESDRAQIHELEKQVKKLQITVADYEAKLDTKSEAINCLLVELAKKSQEIDSIGEMEDVIHDIGDRMTERIDDRADAQGERVTRLLVGRIDDQELRFPLFKDRLTIGRTQQNDIQLKAQYISRRHAVIATEGDATRIIDWGSKNGVYVNSRRVTEHFLHNGDIVTIGTAEFRYEERPKRDA